MLFAGILAASSVWAGNNLWTGGGPNGGDVRDIDLHPVNPNIAYAATPQNGVFKTTDGGQNWFTVNNDIAFANGDLPFIGAVAVDPQSPDTVYAAGINTIYKSIDGGASWSSFFLAGSNTQTLIIDSVNPQILYIAGFSGVQRSSNGGQTWMLMNNGLTTNTVFDIAIDANLNNVLYVATNDGVFKSVDSASNWSLSNTGIVGTPTALAVDPDAPAPGTLYTITGNRVYKSTNGAAGWSNNSTGLMVNSLRDIAVDPLNPMVLYTVDDSDPWKSTDGAASWSISNSGHIDSFTQDIAVSPVEAGTVFTANVSGIYASSDAGGNWGDRSNGLLNTIVNDIGFDPTNNQIRYAATASSIYKTLDGGENWFRTNNNLPSTQANSITSDINGVLYLGVSSGGAFRSTDDGAMWQAINNGLISFNVSDIALVPGSTTNLFAGTGSGGGLFMSADAGANWTQVTNGLPTNAVIEVEIDPLTPSNMFVVQATTGNVLFRSTDSGVSWAPSQSGITASAVLDVAFNPVTPTTLYAATNDGMFKSIDTGANWTPMNTGLPAPLFMQSVTVDPTAPNTVYASSFQGIFISTDAGANWQRLEDGVTGIGDREANTLIVPPLDTNTLLAGMNRLGVQSYTFAGPGITVLPQSISLSEPDGSDTFIVRLDTDPTDPVMINLNTTSSECQIDQTSLSLDATTRFETITVTVVDDVVVDGTQNCDIQIDPATSSDMDYQGMDPADVSVSVADDDTAGILVAPLTLSVSEPDGSDTFTITAQTPPLDTVSIGLSVSNDECSVSPDTVMLTGASPSAMATVQAVDDILLDGDQDCIVMTAPSMSADMAYDGLDAADVTVTVVDTDVAGITVAPLMIDVSENGSNTFMISLDTVPADNVDIDVSTTSAACSLMDSTVTLTPGQISQSVTVFGIDDLMFAGDQACGVTTAVSESNDLDYDGINPNDVTVTVLDTTTAGVQVFPTSGLVTDEDGGSDTFEIVLTAIPTMDVTIGLSSSDPGEGVPSSSMVTFMPGNALMPQTVTVTGVADGVIDPDTAYQIITGASSSGDGNFDGLAAADVSVVNLDVDDLVFLDGFE